VSFVEPRSDAGRSPKVARAPGVMAVEAGTDRPRAAALSATARAQAWAINRARSPARSSARVVDISGGGGVTLPPEAWWGVLRKGLGDILGVQPGDRVSVEGGSRSRPRRER